MGKGDIKTRRGKISNGSYGVRRPRRVYRYVDEVEVEEPKAKKTAEPKEEKPKAKKTTTKEKGESTAKTTTKKKEE